MPSQLKNRMTKTQAVSAMQAAARTIGDVLDDIDRTPPRSAPISAPVSVTRSEPPKERTLEDRIQRAKELIGEFKSPAENFIAAIKAASGERDDPRLLRAPLGANGSDPSAGGFLLQTNFSDQMVARIYAKSFVAAQCDHRETSKPLSDIIIPGIDETSRADGSRNGGVLAFWGDEATQGTKSKPRWKNVNLSARRLLAYVASTNELWNDAPMFSAHVMQVVPDELAFKLDLACLFGTGSGQPLGVMNSSALISVPKETGQASSTIVKENVNNMWNRLPAPSRLSAVWFANEDADAQLEALGGNPGTYVPAGVAGNELPLLKGRPVIAMEQCPLLGMPGDLILADMSKYLIVDGGVKTAISFDVLFDSDEVSLRFTLRVGGSPGYSSPVTPYNGGVTRSPWVALAQR